MSLITAHFFRLGAFVGRRSDELVIFITLVFVFLFLNQHFTRFTIWFPVLLLPVWLLTAKRGTDSVWRNATLLPTRLWLALICYLASILMASLISPFRVVAVEDFFRTLAGPLLIAVLAARVMSREGAENMLFRALVWGGVFLAVTDVAHYVRDFMILGQLPHDFSHRWFSDGYIFYLPFLFLYRDTLVGRRRSICNAGLFLVFTLVAGTGSRGSWGTILLEIIFLWGLTRQRQYLYDLALFGFAITIGLFVLPYEMGKATLERGLSDNNRIIGHWLPALKMSFASSHGTLLIGHGYGKEIWNTFHANCDECYKGPGLGGPHNVFLQAIFTGGLAAFSSLIWLFAELGRLLWNRRGLQDDALKKLALGGFVAFAGFFLIAGQVGDPRPEPLAILMLVAMILHRHEPMSKTFLFHVPYEGSTDNRDCSNPTAPVSIIIPCYRCSETVERAINSALNQTLPPAEILLIDDASGDDSLDLLYRLEKVHAPRVRVVALTKNGGPGLARNAGWEAATQPWLAFLDADDAWHPRKLEIQWTWLESHPEVALCGHASQFSTGRIDFPVEDAPLVTLLSARKMLVSNRLPTRSVMLRRDLPFRFSNRRFSEDYLLWLEIIYAGYPAYRLGAVLAFCFRPDFSPGGISGKLWEHEKGEISALRTLLTARKIGRVAFTFVVAWSYVKFLRRLWLMRSMR